MRSISPWPWRSVLQFLGDSWLLLGGSQIKDFRMTSLTHCWWIWLTSDICLLRSPDPVQVSSFSIGSRLYLWAFTSPSTLHWFWRKNCHWELSWQPSAFSKRLVPILKMAMLAWKRPVACGVGSNSYCIYIYIYIYDYIYCIIYIWLYN